MLENKCFCFVFIHSFSASLEDCCALSRALVLLLLGDYVIISSKAALFELVSLGSFLLVSSTVFMSCSNSFFQCHFENPFHKTFFLYVLVLFLMSSLLFLRNPLNQICFNLNKSALTQGL